MNIVDYASLQSGILNWLGRPSDTDLTTRVLDFIGLFEAEFVRERRVQQMEGRSTATLSGEFIALPTGFLGARSLKITSTDPNYPILETTPQYMDLFYSSSETARPKFFAVVDSEIRLRPVPDSTYTVELDFYSFTNLSNTNTTNWLLTAYPDAYLYGSLVHAATYIGNDSRLPLWEQKIARILTQIDDNDARLRWGSSPMTMRSDTGNP